MALLKQQHTPSQIGKQGMVAMGSQAHVTHGNMHSRVCVSAEQTAVGGHLLIDQQYLGLWFLDQQFLGYVECVHLLISTASPSTL